MKKNFLAGFLALLSVSILIAADRAGWLERAATATAAGTQIIDLKGQTINLEPYRGKVVLLNFWATWCQPCQIEMPWFIEFQDQYGSRGLQVVGVAMDDEGRSVIEPFIQKEEFEVNGTKRKVNYTILIGNEKAGEGYGLFGLPTTLVISRDGKIVKRFVGLVNHESILKELEGQLEIGK